MSRIYHITSVAEATATVGATEPRDYLSAGFAAEGFIHCSHAHQVVPVANRLFRGRQDLVLLQIERERLTCAVVEENLEGGKQLFPHIYGPIPAAVVVATHPFPCDERGEFTLPPSVDSGAESLLQIVQREFRQLRRLADAAQSQLDDQQFFHTSDGGNGVAVLVKHVSGNMRSRWRDFLTTDGEKPDRDRDTEFEILPDDSRESLQAGWEAGWEFLFDALSGLEESDLPREVLIRGEPHAVLQAIHRQLSHYAYHTGQIVTVAKGLRGENWEVQSIAKGESRTFNQAPDSYLGEAGS